MARGTEGRLARAYGQALFLACDPVQLDLVAAQLDDVGRLFRENPDLQEALISRTVTPEQKMILMRALSDRLGWAQSVTNILLILAERGRFVIFEQLVGAFNQSVREFRNLLSVNVAVARQLSHQEENDLVERLRRSVNASLSVSISVEPNILGGLVLRTGDKVFDASMRTRLRRMEASLVASSL
jgi:F-type H+-transporting ATPase subunit delta